MKRPRLQSVAHHEAGHAVAAVILGLQLDSVTIIPDDEAHGRASFLADTSHEPSADVLRLHIVATFAGPLAEQRVGDLDTQTSRRDLETIGDLLLRIASPDELDSLGPILEREAEELVSRNWATIVRVASVLIERGTLSAEGVLRLVETDLA